MNNLIVILLFALCFTIAISGIIGFLMAFRPYAFSNDKKKVERLRKIGRSVLTFFIAIFIVGLILMIYILWSGFQNA
jgi:hypothetical protein